MKHEPISHKEIVESMICVYFTSQEAAGKTALCTAIGKKLIKDGKKVGFFRPVRLSGPDTNDGYKDTSFIKTALGLVEPVDTLSPIFLSRQDLWRSLTTNMNNFQQQLKQTYTTVAKGKDLVLMEGLSQLGIDKVATEVCYQIADVLNARVIIVLRYSRTLDTSKISEVSQRLGQKLMGVVVNNVSKPKIEAITKDMKNLFQKEGIEVLGCLPEDRTLLGASVGELAKSLNGEIITSLEAEAELAENIMLGAMTPDSGIDYFGRKDNKAVVVRGERADMQLAALQTSTKCLILTGNVPPCPLILNEAKDKGVPILLVKEDIKSAIANIETALSQAKFHSLRKLEKFSQILDHYFDFQLLYQKLGVKA